MRILLASVVLAGLGACSTQNLTQTGPQIENPNLFTQARREFEIAYLDKPFDTGVVYVVAQEHGELHTYSLTSCGVERICGPNGRAGHVERTRDHFVVTGAYPDRTFYLSPGGDGFLNWRGVNSDLAWN